MRRPPRDPQEALLSWRFLQGVLGYGCLITASTMLAFLWALDDPSRRTTMSFMTLALAQIFHLGNARSHEPVLRLARSIANPYALGAAVLSVGLQLAAIYIDPLAALLRVERLTAGDWTVVLFLSVIPALFGQTLKLRRAASV
jgi:Ca2+-transporting ATPase